MNARSMLPLIDLVFLTLGVIVAAMTQMQQVRTLPVELARVAPGAAAARTDPATILRIAADGTLSIDGAATTIETVEGLSGRVIVRADRRVEAEALLAVLARLARGGAEVALEVDDVSRRHEVETPARHQAPGGS